MSHSAPSAIAPAPPSAGTAAFVFAVAGPAACAAAFGVFFAVIGTFNMGPGAWFAGAFYFVWFLPFLYVALAVPFALTGIAYAVAARRFARPSLAVALISGVVVFAACLALLYLGGWLAGRSALALRDLNPDDYSLSQLVSNLGASALAIAIGVAPSWWLTRTRGAPLRWI